LVHSEIEIKGGLEQQRSEDFICREEKEKFTCSGTWKLVVPQVRLEIGFYSLFLKLPEGGGVSLVQTDVSWEEEVSPWLIITFWDLLQSTLQTR
jgi:hypothetical protein